MARVKSLEEVQSGAIERVGRVLTGADWQVKLEPRIGWAEPDIVATSPDGRIYIIEVKTDDAPVHTGLLGQLNIWQQAAKAEWPEMVVKPLLLTTKSVDPGLKPLVDRFGLEVVEADSVDELSGRLAGYLKLTTSSDLSGRMRAAGRKPDENGLDAQIPDN